LAGVAVVVLTAATAAANSVGTFIAARSVTAIGASGAVPIAMALLGDLFDFHARGRALGWLFGAMAGGMAVGSTAGPSSSRSSAGRGCSWASQASVSWSSPCSSVGAIS